MPVSTWTYLLVGLLLVPCSARAQSVDSTGAEEAGQDASSDWLVLPFAAYAPETKFSAGVVAGWYGAPSGRHPPSNIQAVATATQRRQLILQVVPEVYLAGEQWRLSGQALVSKFPDAFYGIGGDTPERLEEDFTSRSIQVEAAAERIVQEPLRMGGRVVAHTSAISEADAGGQIASGAVPGANGATVVGVGPTLFADTRDNLYFPTRGAFADASAVWHSAAWGSDASFARVTADLRGYRSAGAVVFAGNLYTEAVVGTVPFELLPQLGGDTYMRGYRAGRYRDNVYWTAQAEVRFPLFWRFRMTAFANVGEVGPRIGADLFSAVQAAAGLGGRFRLTDDGVYGRMDLAYGASGVQLYLSLGEAF